MVEIEDFDWQVFISYSWKDNTGTEKKWVDEFEQLLDAELKRLGQNMRIKLWRDRNQGENEYFTKSIPDGLAQSDLFIGLLSENFLGSGWCPDEIEYFKSYWKDKSPSLLVDGKKSRFFKVLLSDLSIEQLPEPFAQSNPFRFYDENHKNKIRLYSSETAYQQRMEELAGEIVNTINTIIKIMPKQEPERKEEFSLSRSLPVYICLTMRSDYIGDCDIFPGLPELLNSCQYLVPRLSIAQRREAIAGPLLLGGMEIDPVLLERILDESSRERDNLPILQHALLRTFQECGKCQEQKITVEHYQSIGTITNALSRDAESVYEKLNPDEQFIAMKIFQALTDRDPGNRKIRRQESLDNLCSIVFDKNTKEKQKQIMKIITLFMENDREFLYEVPGKSGDRAWFDISHESLIRQWKRLSDWVDDEAAWGHMFVNLAESAEAHAREREDFYGSAKLAEYEKWEQNAKPNAVWAERYKGEFGKAMEFLAKSREDVKRKEDEAAERERKENRDKTRFQVLSVVLFVLLVVAGVMTGFAINMGIEARKKTREANYNLACVYKDRAETYFKSAQENRDVGDYRKSFLYMATALKQEIPADKSIEFNQNFMGDFYINNMVRKEVQSTSPQYLSE